MLRPRILIVDDDDFVREALLDELNRGYQVDAAASGRSAMEYLSRGAYDAVISDLRMPDMSGLVVLDEVKRSSPEAVRILLTGHLDEDAQRATLLCDAPFKVQKPWHDQIEVTLRRALEHRERTRRLRAQVSEAIHAARIEEVLAREDRLDGRANALVGEAGAIDGVLSFEVFQRQGEQEVSLARIGVPSVVAAVDCWLLEAPLVADRSIWVRATGEGTIGREIVELLLGKAKDWFSPDLATSIARRALADEGARERLQSLSNRAALGQMSGAMLHELASVIGSLELFVDDLASFAEKHSADPDTLESAVWARTNISRVGRLFKSMRSLVHTGSHKPEQAQLDKLVNAAVSLCRAYVTKARTVIKIGAMAELQLRADEPLLVQVLVNLIRNAAEASPPGSAITIEGRLVEPGWAEVTVTDCGPGLRPEDEQRLFEPFFTTKDPSQGTGLGLAFSSQVVRAHRGTLRHERPAEGGARFVVRLPV